jgi:hypothetical protein
VWPDGVPVHDLNIYVLLSYGHQRVSYGWRGHEGAVFCCDADPAGCGLQTMIVVEPTDQPVSGWTKRDAPR